MTTKTSGITIVLAVLTAATLLHEAASKRHPFPSKCKCKWDKLSKTGCTNINTPEGYPTYENMFDDAECLPTIPANHRLCYRVKVKSCITNNRLHHACRLFDGTKGYKLDKLLTTAGNDSSVDIQSIPGSEYKTVCFFNVSIPNAGSRNCSGIELQHAKDHPREQYVDRLSESSTNSTDVACKSYIKVFSGPQGEQQHTQPLCRGELAELDKRFHASSSLFIAYWTIPSNSNASFSLRAQCLESN
jgi:hypothetical protein